MKPTPPKLIQSIKNSWLESLQHHTVGALNLPVHPGVRNHGLLYVDVVIIAELHEFLTGELRSIICDHGIGYPVLMDDVNEEGHCLLKFDLSDWSGLNPFGEFVYCHK